MKANYSKPRIEFVSFELSQSISAGCELISNSGDNVCPVEIPQWGMIIISESTCNEDGMTNTPNPDDYVCYNTSSDDYNVFSS